MLLRRISSQLGLPEHVIRAIARRANHSYKSYRIPKRRGGSREIHHPSKQLKAVQRWLLEHVITNWPNHDVATAYRRERSILHNAARHAESRYLLRMDFENFFPSITAEDLRAYLAGLEPRLDWDETDLQVFLAIVCRNKCLTIGAPTSPALSNAICFQLDQRLDAIARERATTYTRYADDLFFSTTLPDNLKDFPALVESVIRGLSYPGQLHIQPSKTRHSSKRGRRQVTGLVLKSDGTVGIGRHRKRFIRGLIHKVASLQPAERRELAGLIAFARSVEPDFVNALILKYGPERIAEVQEM